MLRELISLLTNNNPLDDLQTVFSEMMSRAAEVFQRSSKAYFNGATPADELADIDKADRGINKLERRIRKRVILHLAAQRDGRDAPFCLLLISLVKDVERIGDYSKDLARLTGFAGPAPAAGEATAALRRVCDRAGRTLDALPKVLDSADQAAAVELIRDGRATLTECEELLRRLAAEELPASAHASLLLGAQYCGRILGHSLNVLSSLVVPFHRVDYYDEKDLLREALEAAGPSARAEAEG